MTDPSNPWTTLSSRQVYRNPWIEVVEHKVLMPSGKPGIYGVVHMVHRASGVIAIDTEGRVVLVGQYRYPLERYSWEIVEGGVEAGESPLAGAQRELVEETGLTAEHWRELVRLDLSNSVTDETATAFVAWGLKAGEASPDDSEELELRRVPFAEAMRQVFDEEVTDAISVAALLKLDALLRHGALPEDLGRLLGA